MAMPSTLRQRMIIHLGLMVLGSLAIGVGSMIAVNGLHQDLGAAIQGYRELRQLFDVGFLASKAREATSANPPQPGQAVSALRAAISALNDRSDAAAVGGPPSQWGDESARQDCRRLLENSIDELEHGSQNAASLNMLFGRMSKISDQVRESIVGAQQTADRRQQLAMWTILCLGCTVVMGAIVIGFRQYCRVIGPLAQIGDGVRGFAGGFDRRIVMTGDREFVALADDFNRMADELSALYRDLEQKVQTKSRELVRSERLASVGYLAAGVAHEINNPLGIIAGYGERAMQQLSACVNDETVTRTQKSLAVICEEAFRCRQITDRLLSLARPGSEHRQIVSLATIAEMVVSTLSGSGTVGSRGLTLTTQDHAGAFVLADEGEMKQLILNLIINSLEAVSMQGGEVRVSIARVNDDVQLTVKDNGHGMTPATLDQIFQPFFTEKRSHRHGTGLGLSIAQSIVTDHGGQIEAHSNGPDTGSTFIVRLPAVKREAASA